jgi:flagellar basal-body rod modification protein FlgD
MAIDSVTAAAASTQQAGGIGLQDFLKILTSEMSNQDPLKPLDNQEFIAQVAQFSALEQSRELNQKIDQLLSVQSASQSIGLLGKSVDIAAAGGQVSGQVVALDFVSGKPQLTLALSGGGTVAAIPLDQILSVR